MNGATLAHHAQLIDWCCQKRRHQDHKGLDILHKTRQQSKLSPDKYESIGKWCTEVNRLFIRPPDTQPPQLFRKFIYSNSMFPPNKSTVKSRAVNPPATLWTNPGKRNGDVKSAVLTGQAVLKPQTPEGFVDDEKNTALAAKMSDTNDHYVQERKIVHLNIQPEFKRKLSTGWTINRPMLYPKNPPPAPPENLLVDIPDYLVKNEDNRMEVCHDDDSSKQKSSSTANVENFDVPKIMAVSPTPFTTENFDVPNIKDITEQTYAVDDHSFNYDVDNNVGDLRNKGTQWEPTDNEADIQTRVQEIAREEEPMTPRHSCCRPIISDRSISNNILNVVSVDDCKMAMRYRPMRVIDTQEAMILPPAKSPLPPDHEKEGDSDNEDPEGSADSSQDTPVRLSHGSHKTTLTLTKMKSRVHAYRKMYETCSKTTPESKIPRPSSAAVEKAFDVLLDKQFQACQSSRRPLSCPPKAACTRPSSRASNASISSTHSTKFLQLNATLRQQMYDFVDSRWHSTKTKFQRTKNGYSKSAMKKARMVTSSPKQSWMSDEEKGD